MYYFHKKIKIKKNPKNPFLVGFFRWGFLGFFGWVFLGGFFWVGFFGWVFWMGFLMPTLVVSSFKAGEKNYIVSPAY